MIEYSILTALDCDFFPVIISTDSEEIASLVSRFKMAVSKNGDTNQIMVDKRPPELATDDSTDLDLISHIAEKYLKSESILAYLRPTTPFRNALVIQSAIKNFMDSKNKFQRLICIEELTESAYKNFMLNEDGSLSPLFPVDPNLPNHLYPRTFRNNGYLDLYRLPLGSDQIIEGFITPPTIELDTEDDLEYAEFWLKRKTSI